MASSSADNVFNMLLSNFLKSFEPKKADNHVYGIHTALAKGIDYYDWKLCVIGNKFDKEK